MSTLWSSISHIKVMKGDILDNLFLLKNISLGNGHILLSFQIILGGIRIRSSDPFNCATCRLDVNDITNSNFLFLDVLIDARI